MRNGPGKSGRCRRRGVALIVVALLMVALFGLLAVGIDIGRMHLAKTQLQVAADAAARAGAWMVPSDLASARSRAVAIAAANVADNSPAASSVAVDPNQDITFGRWNPATKTFTALPGPDYSSANAIQVKAQRLASRGAPLKLYFAPVIGISTTDVTATAIAYHTGGPYRAGLVGINSITMNGTTNTDSYDATKGAYNPASHNNHGDILSNGPINLIGTVDVWGNAYPGPGQADVQSNGKAVVHGTVQPLDQAAVFPPVDASPYASNNNNSVLPSTVYTAATHDFALGNNESFTLQGGTTSYVNYYFHNFTIGGNAALTISGKVTIWVTGLVDLSGGGNAQVVNLLPSNFQVRVQGAGPVDMGGRTALYADVYAPQAPTTFHGQGNAQADFFGAIVGLTLTVSGNSDLHYDESLGKQVGSRRVAIVK